MLPGDTDFHADDGNEEITHDFVNTIQRSVDAGTNGMSPGWTAPSPTGTSLPWGGGRIVVAMNESGIADGVDWNVYSQMDCRNRQVVILEFGAFNAANKLPGGGSEEAIQPGYDYLWDGDRTLYTKSGATTGNPPTGGTYLVLCRTADDAMLFCDATSHFLVMRNELGATVYPFLVLWISDQFPTRT